MPAMTDNRLRPEGEAMPRLDDTAVAEGLQHLPGWERRGDEIVKTFMREDFAHAMVFVNEVAGAAEAAGHHPTSTSAGTRSPWPCPATPREG
jgi:pterin-4a-carbinolamine dehydratase